MRKAVAAGLVALGAAAVVLALGWLPRLAADGTRLTPFDAIELKTYDWRLSHTARPDAARKDIALVEIDEYSLRNLQAVAGRWPWPRVVHAELLDYLRRAPARVIVYDVNFAEADTRRGFDYGDATLSGRESDDELVESVKAAGNVILLADATYQAIEGSTPDLGVRYGAEPSAFVERKVVFPPFDALRGAAAALGHNLFVLDADGPIRHVVPFVRTGTQVVPSLGVVAAMRAAGIRPADVRINGDLLAIGRSRMPTTVRRVRAVDGTEVYRWASIDFRGPAFPRGRTYPTYSFFDLLYSEEQLRADVKPNIDPAVFRDRIVFVGTTASGLLDVFETPFAEGRMPGIHVHAAVADDILSNRFIAPAPAGVRVATVLAAALLVGAVATTIPAWWATAATLAIVGVFGAAATRLFAAGRWVNVTEPVLTASLALFGGVGYQYFVEGREKRKMKRLFGQYVSKDVYDHLVADPSLARLGGQRREMSVLFSDIRGFTTVSERGQPEEIVHMLNEYFTRMVAVVFKHRGTVDKFVGDMVMALFGAPLDDAEHARHAVDAALEMIEELQKLNAKWAAEGRPALDIGIGVNSGPMIAGNIGSEAIMSYTVIGDAVNLGSRLESLNKQYGTRIIISDATRELIGPAYDLRPLGDVVVKGKTRPVAIFEVVGRAAAVPPVAPGVETVH